MARFGAAAHMNERQVMERPRLKTVLAGLRIALGGIAFAGAVVGFFWATWIIGG